MRICIIHNYYGNAAPSGENLAVDSDVTLLKAHGHDVSMLRWENDRISHSPLGQLKAAVTCTWNHSAYRHVSRSLHDMKPDVVHIHNTFPQASPAVLYAARRYAKAAVVMTIHNYRLVCANGLLFREGHQCSECVRAGSSWPAIRFGCYRGSRLKTLPVVVSLEVHRRLGTYYQGADAVIALTDFQRDLLTEMVEPDRLFVKPPHYSSPPTAVPWSQRRRHILYVGRLSSEKGVDVLIDALHQAPDAPVCDIIGDGSDRASLQAKVENLGMANRVRFHGMLSHEQTQQAIARGMLLIIPSICNEGFPLVLREALAMGVPVLASEVGSLKEIVTDRWNGRLFDVGRPHALAARLKEMLADDASLQRMADNARVDFVARYGESRIYESLMNIYAQARERRSLSVIKEAAVTRDLPSARMARHSESAPL